MEESSSDKINYYFSFWEFFVHKLPTLLSKEVEMRWNKLYGDSKGHWAMCKEGRKMVAGSVRYFNQHQIQRIKDNKLQHLDCQALISIFHSHMFSTKLTPSAKGAYCCILDVRNELAHANLQMLTREVLDRCLSVLTDAFNELGIDSKILQEIKDQTRLSSLTESVLANHIKELQEYIVSLQKQKLHFMLLPQVPGHIVQQRQKDLDYIVPSIDALYEENKDCVSHVYLSGNPGCGKSQLARQIGEELHGISDRYDFIMTLDASSLENLHNSMRRFGLELGFNSDVVMLKEVIHDIEKDIKRLCCLVKNRLESLYDYWLIIVDNVNSTDFTEFYPHPNDSLWGKGQVIVTTQISPPVSVPSSTAVLHELKMGMNVEDAMSLFRDVSKVQCDEALGERVRVLFDMLDLQPLAIAHTALEVRFLKRSNTFRFETYLDKLLKQLSEQNVGKPKRTRKNLLKENNPAYPHSMLETTVSCVGRMWDGDDVLKCAFHFVAYCDRFSVIPMELILEALHAEGFEEDDGDTLTVVDCCLFMKSESNSDDVASFEPVNVHQVVHKAFYNVAKVKCEDCKTDDGAKCLSKVMQIVSDYCEANAKEKFEALPIRRKLWPHMRHLFDTLNSHKKLATAVCSLDLIKSLDIFKECCEMTSNDLKCKMAIVNTIVKWRIALQGENHPDVGYEKGQLCLTYIKGSDFKKAESLCKEGLSILNDAGDDEVKRSAELIVMLGNIKEEQGDLMEAKSLLEESIEIFKRITDGSAYKEHAYALLCYAASLHRLGEYSLSEEVSRESIEMYTQHFKRRESPEVSNLLNNLGWLLSTICRLQDAWECLQESRKMMQNIHGNGYYGLAYPLINMGIVARLQGYAKAAVEYSSQAVHLFKTTFGEVHTEYAEASDYLGMAYFTQGNIEEAEKCHDTAIKLWQSLMDKPHTKLARFLENKAHIHMLRGQAENALKNYEESLTIRESLCGDENAENASLYSYLGIAFGELGREKERALSCGLKSINLRRNAFGSSSPLVAFSHQALGDIRFAFGDYNAAKTAYKVAQSIYEKNTDYGKMHFRYADCEQKLLAIAMSTGNLPNEFEVSLNQCREIYNNCNFLPSHPSLLNLEKLSKACCENCSMIAIEHLTVLDC